MKMLLQGTFLHTTLEQINLRYYCTLEPILIDLLLPQLCLTCFLRLKEAIDCTFLT